MLAIDDGELAARYDRELAAVALWCRHTGLGRLDSQIVLCGVRRRLEGLREARWQALGGAGYTKEWPVERLAADLKEGA